MALVADTELRKQIAQRVQAALDRHQPSKYRVMVNPDAIAKDDDWYEIVVESENDARDRDFYDALANAEADLQDHDGQNYLLVPAFGD
jgi:hypothetical protein